MFKNLTHLGYKKRQVQNKPTEYYFLIVKHIYKLPKIKKHVTIRTQRVKPGVFKKKSTQQNN